MLFLRVSILILLSCISSFALDWPQLLGPNRNGSIQDPTFKVPSGLSEVWTKNVGEGFGGAVVSEGLIYTLDRPNDDFDVVKCWDLKSGQEKWQHKYSSEARFGFNGSRSAPTIFSDFVYTVGVLGHVTCLNKKTGKLIWQRNLKDDWQAEAPPWGFGSSVLIHDNKCIIAPLSNEAGLVALDYKTGKTVWESKPIGTAPGYSSPVIHTLLNKEMLIQMSGDAIAGVNPKNGSEYWRWEEYTVKRTIPAPVKISSNKLFITGGYESGSVMLKFSEENGMVKPELDFLIEKKGAQVHVPILKDNYLYANFNENDNLKKRAEKQGLTCLDLKGNIIWNTGEKPNLNRGNIILINNTIVALDGDTGELIFSEANHLKYKELYRKKVLEGIGKNIWAPICYTNGYFIIRDQKQMKCLKVD